MSNYIHKSVINSKKRDCFKQNLLFIVKGSVALKFVFQTTMPVPIMKVDRVAILDAGTQFAKVVARYLLV